MACCCALVAGEVAVNADAAFVVREGPAVADGVAALRYLRFDHKDIAVPMCGTLSLAAKDGVRHLAAIRDVVPHDGIGAVFIVLRGGDLELRILVIDLVHTAFYFRRAGFRSWLRSSSKCR